MAIVHVINIHNHPIKFQGRKMKLPIGFDGYINDETGEIIETNLAETYATKSEVDKSEKAITKTKEELSKDITVISGKIAEMEKKTEEQLTNATSCIDSLNKQINTLSEKTVSSVREAQSVINNLNSKKFCYNGIIWCQDGCIVLDKESPSMVMNRVDTTCGCCCTLYKPGPRDGKERCTVIGPYKCDAVIQPVASWTMSCTSLYIDECKIFEGTSDGAAGSGINSPYLFIKAGETVTWKYTFSTKCCFDSLVAVYCYYLPKE